MNAANAALARGDYSAASKEFLRMASEGDARAQTHLGYMYYMGEGVPQDYNEAVKWYRKAAVQGDKDAQYNLAVAYAFGEGTKQDYKEAATWYRRAAEQGHAIAQYSLGISYSYGEGVKQDSTEAVRWFRKSAEQGYARAQVQLASKYHTGDGVALNPEEAVKWYRMAADRGNAAAQYNLGSMYRSGKGVKQDYNQAVRWYRMAADQGYSAATNELASLERAIAGATRSRTKPNLQPAPAKKVLEAKQEAPAEEPLLTVEKSELLTLDDEEEQLEDAVTTEVEPSPAVADTKPEAGITEPTEPEAKKPGRISGFFKKFFKKKETQAETAMATETENSRDTMATDTDVVENDEQMAMESNDAVPASASEEPVPVEDRSVPLSDAKDEMTVEHEVIYNEPGEKKPRFGFFKKLFGKKKSTDEVKVEDHSVDEMEAESRMAETSDTVVAYGSETNRPDDEMTAISESGHDEALQEEVADGENGSSTDMDTAETEAKPKKKGFFKRLFGSRKEKIDDVAEVEAEESETLATDTVAIMDDSADAVPVQEEDVMEVPETEAKPKKKGFFKRLFGSKKDSSDDIAEVEGEESETLATDTVAIVDDSTDLVSIQEEEISIDTSAEEDAAEALETDVKPKKKGFFKRLFGKSDDEPAAVDSSDGHMSESDAAPAADLPSEPAFVADADELRIARQALDNRDYESAFDSFYSLAVDGDATAQYQLGLLYYQGLGVEQNYDEAAHWYRSAGEQGNAHAQYSLGNMYLMGEGVSQDDARAIAWYEKAAAQGHDAAMHNVNNLKRVTSAKSASADEIEKALEHEQLEGAAAETEVASEDKPEKGFFKRLFGKKDRTEETVEDENTVAVVQGPLPELLPDTEENETAEVKEKKKGFFGRLFGKKEDEDSEEMENEDLAASSSEQMQSTTTFDAVNEPEQSIEEALAAVDEYEKGLAYSFGDGVPQDNKAAFDAFLRAAELGHTPAQYKTGVAYAYGEGVDKDPQQAVYWYRKAAEKGYALAQRNLGVMYMNGDGIEQNKPLAFAWYSILAEAGNVMDVHRRDTLQQQLSQAELEQARAIKGTLKH